MAERSQFNPSEQGVYKGTFLENFMLARIAKRVMLLPEEFDEARTNGVVHVHGRRSNTEASIKIAKKAADEGDDAVSFTDITVGYPVGAAAIHSLTAESYVTDEIGDLMNIEPSRRRFTLGASDNDISLYRIMRTITHAQHTVEWAQALHELATADDPTHHHGRNFMMPF